ncbi:plant regulator RWP-RK family protein [Striga asiatica]|uniref:Plant regulator RWP-RK family protein n=1 Tax=Striga asiatica TaxID=4170 RepID=A0A5A7NV21_STRAF|nr:plant regulator RWP-RK family protein [Striga asiatica]
MRPPHSDAAPPPIPLSRNPLRQNLAQITIRNQQILTRIIIIIITIFLLTAAPPLRRRSRSRRRRHEEINLPALELSVRRNHDDPAAGAAGGGRRRRRGGGLLEDVLGVELHDLGRANGAADLLDAAVGVNDSDDVEGPTRQNTRNAASDREVEQKSYALRAIYYWDSTSHLN